MRYHIGKQFQEESHRCYEKPSRKRVTAARQGTTYIGGQSDD
jgi:hypothetical protein